MNATFESSMSKPLMPSTSESVLPLIANAFARRARGRGPKYLALMASLNELVQSGKISAGTLLPSDDETAMVLSVSVGTVQKAMNALRDEGVVIRRQGFGTFVADSAIDLHDVWHFRFLADDGVNYLPLEARAMPPRIIQKRGPWSDFMPGSDQFVVVRRVISVNDEFDFLTDFYFDGQRFGALMNLPQAEFSRTVLRNVLTERFGVITKNSRQMLRVENPSASIARKLKIAPGTPAMILEVFAVDQTDLPIYYQRVVIPENARKLELERSSVPK